MKNIPHIILLVFLFLLSPTAEAQKGFEKIKLRIEKIEKIKVSNENDVVNCIYKDDSNTFWVGMSEHFIKFQGGLNIGKIYNGSINAIVEKGAIHWLGGYEGLAEFRKDLITLRTDLDKDNILITSMTKKGIDMPFWGDSEGNVSFLDEKGTFHRLKHKPTNGNIESLCLYEQPNNNVNTPESILMAATPEGIFILNWKTEKWKQVKGLRSASKIKYLEKRESFFIIGINDKQKNCLAEYNIKEGKLIYHNKLKWGSKASDLTLREFTFDKENRLWITSNKGLIVYNPFEEIFARETSLKYEGVSIQDLEYIALEDNKQVWISGKRHDLGLYRITISLMEDHCGINKGRVLVNFLENTINYEDVDQKDIDLENIRNYLSRNLEHKISLASGSNRNNLSKDRLELLKRELKLYDKVNERQILIDSNRSSIHFPGVEITFICD